MGSNREDDPDADESERVGGKAHRVDCVDYDYWMARYPVTVGQYAVFLADGGYTEPRWWGPGGLDWLRGNWDSKIKEEFIRDWLARRNIDLRQQPMGWAEQRAFTNRPVVGVCWFEAQAYCRWLDERIRRLEGTNWIGPNYHVQ